MTIRTAIKRTLVVCGILLLAASTGAAIVHAHTQGRPAADMTGAVSAPAPAPSLRDPANLADRLLLDKLVTIPR